ncbi:MAG: hypothetical protein J6J33_06425 [Clostridia bacterium]|nr:hypothetical protein [Clostridia bacterium]
MEFSSKPGELLKLENDKVFLVLKNIEYKNENYLYLCVPVEDPNDFFDKSIQKTTFAKEINEDGNVRLEEVLDQKLYNALVKIVKEDSILIN